MSEALNVFPERENTASDMPMPIDNADISPINEQSALVMGAINRLKIELKLCELFLKSGNITDGPLMDGPVEQVGSRANQIRAAIKSVVELNISDPDFDEKLNNILSDIFPHTNNR